MKLNIRTKVAQDYQTVWQNFNSTLFQALNPPFPPVKLLRFDGSEKGNEVHLELNFILFKQKWVSLIVEQQEVESDQTKEIYFVDKGTQLPFFLKFWKHKHRIIQQGEGAIIADEIEFKSPFLLLDYLLYPTMLLQFAYRKPVYKKYFARK
ncbi:MAG: ligand-binding SRPBCC domain-containing protein [Bacteroidia bacterium]|jgi:ligand-binding SRPBCC domain-containing protein